MVNTWPSLESTQSLSVLLQRFFEMEDIKASTVIPAELSSLDISDRSTTNRDQEVHSPAEATVHAFVQLNPEDSVPSKKAKRWAAQNKARFERRQAFIAGREARQQKAPDVESATNSNLLAKHEDIPQLEPKLRMSRTSQKARNSAHENQLNRIYGYHDYEAKALEEALNNMQLGDAVPTGPRRKNKAGARKTRKAQKRLEEETRKQNLENCPVALQLLYSDRAEARKILLRLKEIARQAILENAFGEAPSCNSTEQQTLEVSEFQRIIQTYRGLSKDQWAGPPISDDLIKPILDPTRQPMSSQGLELAQAILRENSPGQKHNWGKVFELLGKPHQKGGNFWASDYAMALMVVAEAEVSRQRNAFNNRKPNEVVLGLWNLKQIQRRQFVLKLAEESTTAAKKEEQADRVQRHGIAVDSKPTSNFVDNETLDAIEGISAQYRNIAKNLTAYR